MYSKKIESILESKKLRIGERILVTKGEKVYEGLLMPRIELGDQDCIVIKLDSGYNIGVRFEHGMRIERSDGMEPKEVQEEEEYELGKTNKRLLGLSFDPAKPPISLIATGGTIASRVDYRTGGVSMQMKPQEFLFNVPELAGIANLKTIRTPFTIFPSTCTITFSATPVTLRLLAFTTVPFTVKLALET